MPEPWRTIQGENGLWAFRLYGEQDADTVVILLPGMGVPARYYEPLLREWLTGGSGRKTAVVQADFIARSVGRSQKPATGRDGFAALVEDCVPSILESVRNSFPGAAPVMVGHSLGGQLGLIAAARFAPEIPVVLVASGSLGHQGFPGWRRWQMLIGALMIGPVTRAVGHWPGDKLGVGGRQPAALALDWAHAIRTGRYRARTGSFDYESALGEYRGKVLAITMDDDIFAPPTATQALLAKASAARVTRQSYSPSRGSARPGPHFTWVKDQPDIARWLLNGRQTA